MPAPTQSWGTIKSGESSNDITKNSLLLMRRKRIVVTILVSLKENGELFLMRKIRGLTVHVKINLCECLD